MKSIKEAICWIQINGKINGNCVYEVKDNYFVGTQSEAEERCQYSYIETRDGSCRIWQRAYRETYKWTVHAWVPLENVLLGEEEHVAQRKSTITSQPA